MAVCSIMILIIKQFGLHILNVILATNISRLHQILFTMEYFLDQEEFFFIQLINMFLYIGAIAVVATGSLCICYFQHMCGIFEIARYRNTYKNGYKSHDHK